MLTMGDMHNIYKCTKPDKFGQDWLEDLYSGLIIEYGRDATNFGGIFEFLLKKRIIRPGLEVRCDACFASDWYHVSEFTEDVVCRYCFGRQRMKFGSAPNWRYKSDGLFRLPGSAEGSLAVILALWRLNEVGSEWNQGRYATGVSLCNAKGAVQHEIDYCWLNLDSRDSPYELVLGEAKCFNDYEEEKITRLAELAECFDPRPYIAFATLKEEFSDGEKKLLRILVDAGLRVLPFTRLELDPYDLHARFESAPRRFPVSFREMSESLMHVNM